jgi:hypothetical protein
METPIGLNLESALKLLVGRTIKAAELQPVYPNRSMPALLVVTADDVTAKFFVTDGCVEYMASGPSGPVHGTVKSSRPPPGFK